MTSNDPKIAVQAPHLRGHIPFGLLALIHKARQSVADRGSSAVQDITVKKCTIKLLFHAWIIGAGSPCWVGKNKGGLRGGWVVPSKLCADSLCECQANTIRATVREQGC